ncbi:MAG TPA: metallophosphoesterase [Opitutaceae bacterium]|nr:metallophosphoesterase [Opitutaceae bacterium]
MKTSRSSAPLRGVVVSDLHLFAQRSAGADYFAALKPQLIAADVLVLNGDIFDFRWSTLPSVESTAVHALEWLAAASAALPACDIHYVLGNHDCPTFFQAKLAEFARGRPRLHCHPLGLRIGPAVFVHGDCAHRKMDPAGLRRYRAAWDNDRGHRPWQTRAYVAADRIGVTALTHRGWFPREKTVGRVTHYLDRAQPGWRERTGDCYFGHTHLPFSNHRSGTIRFHNTGSGIRGMGFNPVQFSVEREPFESLN